jgi:hypothetical protein
LTKAPLPGSPALDQGYSFGNSSDQRGRPRIFDFTSIPNAADGSDIGAVEVIPPLLSIAPAGANVLLSWPVTDSGYILQVTPELSSAANWSNLSYSVTVVGGQNTATDSVASGNAYYRLVSH